MMLMTILMMLLKTILMTEIVLMKLLTMILKTKRVITITIILMTGMGIRANLYSVLLMMVTMIVMM